MKLNRPSKSRQKVGLGKLLFMLILVILFAKFVPPAFEDSKTTIQGMSAVSDMRTTFRNVMQFATKTGELAADEEKQVSLFWTASGLGELRPWWSKCFDLRLVTTNPQYIYIAKTSAQLSEEERKTCNGAYGETQIIRWLQGNTKEPNKLFISTQYLNEL